MRVVYMENISGAREVVMAYIEAMDKKNFDDVRKYMADNVFVKGPAGEAFRSPDEFINMIRAQAGKPV